ncbi:CYTH domain-containing protein [Halofilum ochraceum]|uniref:CYTH domain-containing protein n=1 Tax=Halofilum ochraceum TaxID=1611323 RepID=UPI0008D8D77B|nr:CYTH domain-containing protein [Halofilum ochraceum]
MGTEIERKFLVTAGNWRDDAISRTNMRQGFLSTEPARTVRVRLTDGAAELTIKGITVDAQRAEYEYSIPPTDAAEMLDGLCQPGLIEKTRYRVPHAGHIWEVDEFQGANTGLIVAEIELEHADEAFALPGWIGEEVTGNPRYYNASLVNQPYSGWE